ncbi:MAG: hypothetical protein NV1_08 [Nanoarchaeotal virus 1]|nr:MAG: hypothetical protein NV1_08 [Nanoarchaeotal virus 1]
MKIQLVEKYLNIDLSTFLKESLASHYKDVLMFKDPVPSVYIKILAYHAIAYFQYLNSFNVKKAIDLYKKYILSDGKESSFYYQGLKVPLKFDDLLINVSSTLMNYKDIVRNITVDGYTIHFRCSHNIIPTYITINRLLDTFKKIGFDGIAALNRHWNIINKELLPHLLKDLKE